MNHPICTVCRGRANFCSGTTDGPLVCGATCNARLVTEGIPPTPSNNQSPRTSNVHSPQAEPYLASGATVEDRAPSQTRGYPGGPIFPSHGIVTKAEVWVVDERQDGQRQETRVEYTPYPSQDVEYPAMTLTVPCIEVSVIIVANTSMTDGHDRGKTKGYGRLLLNDFAAQCDARRIGMTITTIVSHGFRAALLARPGYTLLNGYTGDVLYVSDETMHVLLREAVRAGKYPLGPIWTKWHNRFPLIPGIPKDKQYQMSALRALFLLLGFDHGTEFIRTNSPPEAVPVLPILQIGRAFDTRDLKILSARARWVAEVTVPRGRSSVLLSGTLGPGPDETNAEESARAAMGNITSARYFMHAEGQRDPLVRGERVAHLLGILTRDNNMFVFLRITFPIMPVSLQQALDGLAGSPAYDAFHLRVSCIAADGETKTTSLSPQEVLHPRDGWIGVDASIFDAHLANIAGMHANDDTPIGLEIRYLLTKPSDAELQRRGAKRQGDSADGASDTGALASKRRRHVA